MVKVNSLTKQMPEHLPSVIQSLLANACPCICDRRSSEMTSTRATAGKHPPLVMGDSFFTCCASLIYGSRSEDVGGHIIMVL